MRNDAFCGSDRTAAHLDNFDPQHCFPVSKQGFALLVLLSPFQLHCLAIESLYCISRTLLAANSALSAFLVNVARRRPSALPDENSFSQSVIMAQANPANQLLLVAVAAHGPQPVGVPAPVAAAALHGAPVAAAALHGAHTQFDVEAGISGPMPTKSNKGYHIHAAIA